MVTLQGIKYGVADQLNTFVGGNIIATDGCRFCDDTGAKHIPNVLEFTAPGSNPYGNNSTADYLADSFAYSIFNPEYVPFGVTWWINTTIISESQTLP